MSVAPSVSSIVWSAFRSGSLWGVRVRPSSRSRSGVVVVLGFSAHASAATFAARWAGRLGLSVVVRRTGGFWCVSVPVAGCVPFWGQSGWRCAGGVRRVSAVASAASLALL